MTLRGHSVATGKGGHTGREAMDEWLFELLNCNSYCNWSITKKIFSIKLSFRLRSLSAPFQNSCMYSSTVRKVKLKRRKLSKLLSEFTYGFMNMQVPCCTCLRWTSGPLYVMTWIVSSFNIAETCIYWRMKQIYCMSWSINAASTQSAIDTCKVKVTNDNTDKQHS